MAEIVAHTMSNATKAGLLLWSVDEYGECEFAGNRKQWRIFNALEAMQEMENNGEEGERRYELLSDSVK